MTQDLTHAGNVVVRGESGATRYLIVRAKANPDHWVLPKGHIDPGETPEAAAARELREEAGVAGDNLGLIGITEFAAAGEEVRCAYFLVRFREEVAREEERGLRWCGLEEALGLLNFEEGRDLLRKGAARLGETSPP